MVKTEVGKKFLKILQDRNIPVDDLTSELEQMELDGVLPDLLEMYLSIQSGVDVAGSQNIVNSQLAYRLGMTTCPPTGPYAVQLRRTYARAGWPDVDMDFDYRHRHIIDEYWIRMFGEEHVGKIGTVQTLKVKNVIRRVVKVLDPENSVVYNEKGEKTQDESSQNYQLQSAISNTLPKVMKSKNGGYIKKVEEAYETYPDFKKFMDEYPEVYRVAKKMQGGMSGAGVHASGVILSPVPLKFIAPYHVTRGKDGQEKTFATQFTMTEIEALGLIKFDVLAITTRTAVEMARQLIKDNYGIELDVTKIPLDDKKVLTLLRSAKTDGVFQLEEPGMKRTIQQIGIDRFIDLAAAVAMFRPGPMQFIPLYAERKKNPKSVKYLHPIIKQHTESTYGIIVFQETAMRIFVDLAGLSEDEGYLFIKGAAKKKPELFNSLRDRFVAGASKKASEGIASAVWNQLQPFCGYAFNMSHAVSYAYESWKTAYLKAYYPVEFMTARMSVESECRQFDTVDKYEKDCVENLNIQLLPADINRSKMQYTIVGSRQILRPLMVKGMGEAAAQEIVNHQPYDPRDLLKSLVDKVGHMLNTRSIEALHSAGLLGKQKKAQVVRTFEVLQSDRRKAKGRPTGDMFE